MKKLWILLISVCVISFAILGWIGVEIFREAPPIPREVVTTDGRVLIPEEQIMDGQNVWQAMGGMQVGSIWGHGSYVAPDWTADYLHREALFILNHWAGAEFGGTLDTLHSEQRAALQQRLQDLVRTNRYDPPTGRLSVHPLRAQAFEENLKHYSQIFSKGSSEFAIQANAQSDPEKLRQLNSFFFWTAWASVANRPNNNISYTSNFPSEPLVGNVPTSSSIIWTGVSVILLIASIGLMTDLRTRRIPNWLTALKPLFQTHYKQLVPGHGPAVEGEQAGRSYFKKMHDYLEDFYGNLEEIKAGRKSRDEVRDRISIHISHGVRVDIPGQEIN